jgi:diguanylate cyclase (GGDEF)-like protein
MEVFLCGGSHDGMMQRGAVLRRLDEELARSRRDHMDLSVGLLEIDGLERVDEESGREACDTVVNEIVRRVRGVLRPYDVLGRLALDEFLLLLPGTNEHDVVEVLGRLRGEITARPYSFAGIEMEMNVSQGGATGREESREDLVAKAYGALKEARTQGQNEVVAGQRVELEAVLGER